MRVQRQGEVEIIGLLVTTCVLSTAVLMDTVLTLFPATVETFISERHGYVFFSFFFFFFSKRLASLAGLAEYNVILSVCVPCFGLDSYDCHHFTPLSLIHI